MPYLSECFWCNTPAVCLLRVLNAGIFFTSEYQASLANAERVIISSVSNTASSLQPVRSSHVHNHPFGSAFRGQFTVAHSLEDPYSFLHFWVPMSVRNTWPSWKTCQTTCKLPSTSYYLTALGNSASGPCLVYEPWRVFLSSNMGRVLMCPASTKPTDSICREFCPNPWFTFVFCV